MVYNKSWCAGITDIPIITCTVLITHSSYSCCSETVGWQRNTPFVEFHKAHSAGITDAPIPIIAILITHSSYCGCSETVSRSRNAHSVKFHIVYIAFWAYNTWSWNTIRITLASDNPRAGASSTCTDSISQRKCTRTQNTGIALWFSTVRIALACDNSVALTIVGYAYADSID